MGCDIHAHMEVKINGEWQHYTVCQIDRRYSLFGKMAGVGNASEEPISEPRGMPDNATLITTLDKKRWGEDGHTPSWLSSDELMVLREWWETTTDDFEWHPMERQFGYIFGNTLYLKKYPDEMKKCGIEDYRVVFWFNK